MITGLYVGNYFGSELSVYDGHCKDNYSHRGPCVMTIDTAIVYFADSSYDNNEASVYAGHLYIYQT